MKRSRLRSDPAKIRAWQQRSRQRLGRGKRTLLWDKIRRLLKPLFEAAGITTCEFRYPGCWYDNALGFLHTKKRRNLKPHELTIVALGCNICHDKVELLPEAEMERVVLAVIAKRIRQPAPIRGYSELTK